MADPESGRPASGGEPPPDGDERTVEERVEEKYDFDDFTARDMAEMTPEEWEAAFDADAWITGTELLDRVETDLRSRVEARDVFAVVERERREFPDGETERVLAYSDEGYAAVYEDGSVEGEGTVLRDVKPTVALCSMGDYEVPEPRGDGTLPDPDRVEEGTGRLGHVAMQAVAAAQVLGGVVLFGGWIAAGLPVWTVVVSFVFVTIGAVLFLLVANARLSDRFRSEEYRDRLRAVAGERPEFVPDWGPDAGGADAGDDDAQGV